jgi:membrane protein YdbS with pleckstrin-like domain
MKCPACGVDVVDKSVFCHKCGERLDSVTSSGNGTDRNTPVAPPADTQRPRLAASPGQPVEAAEETLWEGGYCAKAMAGAWAVSLLVTIILLIVGFKLGYGWFWWCVLAAIVILWGYQAVVLLRRRLGVRYRLTTQRFFHESGILIHTTDLIEVIDMDDITYRQTLLDRFMGVGTIRIVSSDCSHPDLSIDGIENVKDVAAKLHDARHAERVRRGLHIESI